MKQEILKLTNNFLMSKGKPCIEITDTLYSSGILDSMDMVELRLYLNNNGIWVEPTLEGSQLNLDEMDTVEKLEKIVKK